MDREQERSKEHPSTYVVQDRASLDELTRLRLQDQMLTENMGGVLPEQTDPTRFQRVLDVGCGTGGWLITLAQEYPSISMLAGADVSATIIKAAREYAEEKAVSDRVEFHVMDALRMLEFPRNYFDLVNHRLNSSYLRKWDWPNLLQESQRVSRYGGVVRVTDSDIFFESNSQAYNALAQLVQEAMFNAGHLFTPGREGVTSALPDLLHQQGLVNVEKRSISMEYRNSSPLFSDDVRLVFRTMLPFLRKWTHVPENYEQLYQQTLQDIQQPDFRAVGKMVTVWGTNVQMNENIPQTEHHS